MKVILMSDIRQTGRRGEVVNVKPGFARNYLFPQGLANPATPGNLKMYEQQRANLEAALAKESKEAVAVAAQLEGTRISITKRATDRETLYGSVTPFEIVEALEAQGHEIDKSMVDVGSGIKSVGEHEVRILLHADVEATITVDVQAEA